VKVLVIAAHPDDEVLGCGGTMARLAAEGHTVRIGILGEGWTARFTARTDAREADINALHQRSQDAARLLGASDVRFGGLPDNRFDAVPLLDVVKILERWISEDGPDRIYTQHGGDLNIDHQVTYRATLTATRPLEGSAVREVLAYEVASSTEWAFGSFAPVFRPNLFVDISATLDRKIDAMALYESEVRAFPHPRSADNLRACAHRWRAGRRSLRNGSCICLM
jgi:LmbE family N-acetylglucosaminyl deacetylase